MTEINIKKPSIDSITEAVEIIKNGGVVILPTDTNYNVVTSPYSKAGVDRIFDMKKRESLSPLTLFCGDSIEIFHYTYLTPLVEKLARVIWPEKVSFVLYQKPTVPDYVTRGFGTVAVTVHENSILREIARKVGTPLAGTSANLSGTGNVPNVEKAVSHIGKDVDLIIDNGISPVDNANTIIDFTFDRPIVARVGAYSVEKIKNFIPSLDDKITNEEYKILAKRRIGSL